MLGVSGFKLPVAFISPSGGEFLLVMLALIMLFGAKDAPRIFRSIHSALDKIQRAAASFRYKMMYSDLTQDTPSQTPYDVEDEHPEEEEQESEVGNQKSETTDQKSDVQDSNPENPAASAEPTPPTGSNASAPATPATRHPPLDTQV
jgi:Sec-independent protein translocase protein TatA